MYRIHRAVHWASLDAYIRSLGPAGWFRMDQGVTVTGAGISQVDDLSGKARHLLDPGTTRPIYLPYSGTRYLYLPGVAGNYASTPDSAANSITGDIDIRVRVALDDWTPASDTRLVCKRNVTTSFDFLVQNTSGLFAFYDGAATIPVTTAPTAVNGTTYWFRMTVDVDNGAGGKTVTLYQADDQVSEPTSWSAVGSPASGGAAGALTDTTNAITVGMFGNGTTAPLAGKLYRAIIKNGIDGTTVVDFNPADADGDGDTSFASSTTGETWTVNSSGSLPAQIVGRASALFNGTSHYLKCNSFTLNQPTCVLMVLKQVSWTASDTFFDGDSLGSMRALQSTSSPTFSIAAGGGACSNSGLIIGTIGVMAAAFNGAASLSRVNNTAAVVGNPGSNNAGGFTLGATGSAVANSNIQVYETVIFPIAPSTAQLDRLVAGLMARHGVA